MAELKNGLLNGGSGRIGNIITYERNGKYFARARPSKVNQPNTEKQLIARKRFAVLQPVNALLKEVYRYGFAADFKARPAYSAALSWNLKHAVTGIYPDLEVDFSALRLFHGSRTLPADIQIVAENNVLQWAHTEEDRQYANDRAALILIFPEKNRLDFRLEAAKRSDGQLSYTGVIPEGGAHVYLSFYGKIPVRGAVTEADVCPSYYCGMMGNA